MSTRYRKMAAACAGVVTAGLLATGAVLPSPDPPPPPDPLLSPSPGPPPGPASSPVPAAGVSEKPGPPKAPEVTEPAFGAYLDYGPEGVQRMTGMRKWLGGADIRVGHTYLPGDVWSNIEGAPGFLADWAEWRKARADRLFVLNVPMLEDNEAHLSDAAVRRRLAGGARGAYDSHFEALGRRLVGLGAADTVIVLGWEMNGTTYTHRCGPAPAAWKTYWNRIVTTMRAVPGQRFRFDFAPNRGRDAIPWTECYPGDDVVDIIGMDSYDQPPGDSFDEQVNEPYGLRQQVDFAAAHGKVISYPEWGLFRNGDNPGYMRGMLQWMDQHKPLYNTLTDYCPHGVWQCEQNPESSLVFRSMMYGRGTGIEPGTPPANPPAPQPPSPGHPRGCDLLDLGSWINSWLGGKVCVRTDWSGRLR
ncbi:glycoside hydrolase family 26 protein [Streptomyces sp. NPDC088725]|uniref:glycoside hydrolase family 26 protein n=1 Tax=Streptomyces sp. NPDC088725 TaxID=3365873 RepID=UPI0037FC35DF